MTITGHAHTPARVSALNIGLPHAVLTQRSWVWIRRGIMATAFLVAAQGVSTPALDTIGTGGWASGVSLERAGARLWLSPVTSILEQLALLPARCHIAIIASVVFAAFVFGAMRDLRMATWRSSLTQAVSWSVRALAIVIAVYLLGALVPWPMAALRHPADEVAVDFHSHTDRSHDGRWSFSAARNAEWHRSGGFDVAYLTDHADSAAASTVDLGSVRSPILLPGAEFSSAGAHVVRLGLARERSSALVLTAPFPPSAATRLRLAGTTISAVEAIDASPRGLQWSRDHPDAARAASAQLSAPLIAASNQHGWGRTAVAWTLLRLPGWHQNTAAELDERIRSLIRAGDTSRIRVIRRRGTEPLPALGSEAWVVPLFLVTVLRTLDQREVVVWLMWIWVPILGLLSRDLVVWRRGRLARSGEQDTPATRSVPSDREAA